MAKLFWISLWFQCLWFTAVLGQSQWQHWTLALVILTCVLSCRKSAAAWSWCLWIALAGIALDSLNQALGLLVFDDTDLPNWLQMLWLAFAWYSWWMLPALDEYSRFMVVPIAALLGALSYSAGAALDAVAMPFGILFTGVVMTLEWSVLMTIMLIYRARLA